MENADYLLCLIGSKNTKCNSTPDFHSHFHSCRESAFGGLFGPREDHGEIAADIAADNMAAHIAMFRRRRRRHHRIAVRGKDLQPGGRQGQAGLSWRLAGHSGYEKHGRGFRFYQHMLKVRHELKVRSIAPVIRRLYCIHCSDHSSLTSVLVVHEWPSMRIWMRTCGALGISYVRSRSI